MIDGTFLYKGENKNYIISILEKKAYQIHYETNMKPYDFIQLCDERLLTHEYTGYCIYEKDSNGIFQKKVEKDLPSLKGLIQIRDNVILGRDSLSIYFIDANTLNITDKIEYNCWKEYASEIGMLSENLCVIKNKETTREYALIDLNKKEIIDYKTKDEEDNDDEYYQDNEGYGGSPMRRKDIMCHVLPLPDGSIFTLCYMGDWTLSVNKIIYWDNSRKEISSKNNIQLRDERRRPMDFWILDVLENGYVIIGANYHENKLPDKYYLLK